MIICLIIFLLFYHTQFAVAQPRPPPSNNMNRLLTQHVTLNCDFTPLSSGHICTARNLNITSRNVTFIRVSTENSYGIRNENLKNLIISRQNLLYIPEGLSNFFRNLEIFTVFESKLKALRFTDFTGLSKLKRIFITGNQIESIDVETFTPIPHLEVLDLTDNKITSIPFKLFMDAKELKILTLSNNLIRIFDIFPLPVNNQLKQLRLNENQLVRINLATIGRAEVIELVDLRGNFCINLSYPDDEKVKVNFYTEIVRFCNDERGRIEEVGVLGV